MAEFKKTGIMDGGSSEGDTKINSSGEQQPVDEKSRYAKMSASEMSKELAQEVDLSDNQPSTETKQISPREYAVLSSEVMRQQAQHRGKPLPKKGTAFTRDYFYVYRNGSIGNFDLEMQIPIEGNEDFIDKVLKLRR